MITVIHGDDVVSTRNFLLELEKKSDQPIKFLGSNLNLTDLVEAIEGDNLLFEQDKKQIFIEDFFSKKQSTELTGIISYLEKHAKNADIKIWEGKELSKKQLNSFKNALIKSFALPKSLFLFLDELKPQNSKKLIFLFHKTLETTEGELIFYMIIRQFRLLLAISKSKTKGNIDEVARLAPWQKSKLEKQASLFSTANLKNIYKKISDIEIGQKTGASALSLPQAIDFLLLDV